MAKSAMASASLFVSKAASSVDLLSLPFAEEGEGISRRERVFWITKPWARARFGKITLRRGWWRVISTDEPSASDGEITLRSPRSPLVVMKLRDSSQVLLFLPETDCFEISLTVSCWPGDYSFSRLALERLDSREALPLLVQRAIHAVQSGRLISGLLGVAKNLIGGGAVGVRLRARQVEVTPIDQVGDYAPQPLRLVEANGLCALLREGDHLHRDAFQIVQRTFEAHPDLEYVYADTLERGALLPKPAEGTELAHYYSYFDTPIFLEATKEAPKEIWDRVGRAFRGEGGTRPYRIALPLAERSQPARPRLASPPTPVLSHHPLVSIIIPTKYRTDLLEKCLMSLRSVTTYPNKELLVVDNGHRDKEFRDLVRREAAALSIKTIEDHRPFNFSLLMNSAAKSAEGEVILLLNDDIEAIQPDWLDRMVQTILEPGVGAVGARLQYPDGSIQHAGVTLGVGGTCGHLWKHTPDSAASRNPYIVFPSERSAVTGACLLIRKSTYARVGGLDERFPFNFGDIDLCLRLRALALKIVYRGDAALVHHESKSTGRQSLMLRRSRKDRSAMHEFVSRWGKILDDDPFGSPAFEPASELGDARQHLLKIRSDGRQSA